VGPRRIRCPRWADDPSPSKVERVVGLLVVGEALAEFIRPSRDTPLGEIAEIIGPFPSGAPAIFASAAGAAP
jgi:hypothetical protein